MWSFCKVIESVESFESYEPYESMEIGTGRVVCREGFRGGTRRYTSRLRLRLSALPRAVARSERRNAVQHNSEESSEGRLRVEFGCCRGI